MKKIIWGVLAAGLLAVTAGISAQSVPFDGISIPFDQEIYIVQEELENSADELLLTLLYASDPEIAADGEAEICEVESADIENSFRTYMENISAGGLDAVQPPVPIDADGCTAVRIRYRFAPSPIPADAELIFAQLDFGQPALEFIYADPASFEYAGTDGALANRFLQRRNELTISPSFFGETGAKAYDRILKTAAPQVTDWAPATRDRYRISVSDVLFGPSHLELSVLLSSQYVHRDFSRMDWNMVGNNKEIETVEAGTRFLLDGKMIGGTDGGGDGRFADKEQFDGPIHVAPYPMAFNPVGLMTATPEMRLYRMNWIFYSEPKLRFAFTPDGQAIYHWTTKLNYYGPTTFSVDFPGMENIRVPDQDDPYYSFSQ